MGKRRGKAKEVVVLASEGAKFEELPPVTEDVAKPESTPEVQIVQPTVKAAFEYVTPNRDLRNTFIGGKYYNLSANVKVKLPADVVRIFRERDFIREL